MCTTTVAHVCDVLALVVVPDKGGERGRKGSPAKPKNVRKSGERAHWYSISSSPPRRATGGFRKRPKQKHVRQTVATGQKSVIRVSRVFVVSARVKNEQELPAFPAHKKMSPVFSTTSRHRSNILAMLPCHKALQKVTVPLALACMRRIRRWPRLSFSKETQHGAGSTARSRRESGNTSPSFTFNARGERIATASFFCRVQDHQRTGGAHWCIPYARHACQRMPHGL